MEYLRVLDLVRGITGARREDAFPARPTSVTTVRDTPQSRGVVFVHDAAIAKAVLQSPRYRQFNFLARILEAADGETTREIRRFCDIGLIMIDGPEHLRRREAMAAALERCISRLQQVHPARFAAAVAAASQSEAPTARNLANALVVAVFAECVAAISRGEPIALPDDDLASIDFFNPFPTLSTLRRCDAALGRCAARLSTTAMSDDDQAAVLSLLIMGVSPVLAILTAAINACVHELSEGRTADEATAVLRDFDAYSVVPTNFVMRECVTADDVAGASILPGDVVYVFLATTTGCPFSRQDSLPFGAGAHQCSGLKLTSVMLSVARKALADSTASLRRVRPSPVVRGKAYAFLLHRDEPGEMVAGPSR